MSNKSFSGRLFLILIIHNYYFQKLSKKLGYNEKIEMATLAMNNVANHINEVQRQNEDRLYLQDIQENKSY